jgi:hypothetical protein
VERPQAALTLQYLLTFIGSEADFEPERLLGSVVRTLHAHPLLTRAEIDRMVQAALDEDPQHPLGLVDLAEQPDLVRFTPLALSLDELANLWSSFFQVEYRLSVAYQATVVLLTTDASPVRALPVRDRRLFLTTLLRPRIRTAVPVTGPAEPIVVGTVLRIEGSQLRGDESTVVRFGDASALPVPTALGASRIEVAVPPDVRAGAVGLRIEHRRLMGEPPGWRAAGRSNVVPVVIHPRIRPTAGGHLVAAEDVTAEPDGTLRGTLSLTVDPAVGFSQDVEVVLNALDGSGASLSFTDERRDGPGAPAVSNTLDIPFTGLPAGDHLVRVVVDGADSPLDVQTTPGPNQGAYVAPRVTVP